MKLKTLSLFLAFLCSGILLAQNYNVELFDVKTVQTGDSLIVTSTLQVNMPDMPTRYQLRMTPVLVAEGKSKDFGPVVLLNGKKQHNIYKRQVVLDQRKAGTAYKNNAMAYEYKGGVLRVVYRGAAPLAKANAGNAQVLLRQEMLDANGAIISTKTLLMKGVENSRSSKTNLVSSKNRAADALGAGVNDIVELKQDFSVLYKGSYLQPAEDAIYERNQKELRFSLQEAKVIAEINPHMLSLRELYSVAESYVERPAMFHKIIKISVELYPSDPIANLNAAASSIELGDIEAAAKFLQVAPHDTLAYVNCRGAYELMLNNVQEGLRLLKSASAKGSVEADENLKIFFGSFKE